MRTKKPAAKKPVAKKRAAKGPTPDLMTVMQKGTGMKTRIPRSEMPTKTADQIAAELEAEGKKYLDLAKVLRGTK